MRGLIYATALIELIGMVVMSAVALKAYFEFKRRGRDALSLMLGPLLMALGVAVVLARRAYYWPHLIIPPTATVWALIIGLVLAFAGGFMITRDWHRGRSGGERAE